MVSRAKTCVNTVCSAVLASELCKKVGIHFHKQSRPSTFMFQIDSVGRRFPIERATLQKETVRLEKWKHIYLIAVFNHYNGLHVYACIYIHVDTTVQDVWISTQTSRIALMHIKFIYLFIHSFIHSINHSCIHSFINLFFPTSGIVKHQYNLIK